MLLSEIPVSALFSQRGKLKRSPSPSAPAQDAPAYKKAQVTSRRVNTGRHLGDSPTERVSLWKWCQQQSVEVERLLCWCLWREKKHLGSFSAMKAKTNGWISTAQPRTVPVCGIKQSLPWAALPSWMALSCWVLSMSCSHPMYGLILLSISGTAVLSQRGFQN